MTKMTNWRCPTCGSRVFSIHPLASDGICPDSFHVNPRLPTREERADFIIKLWSQGIIYVPLGSFND